MMGMENARFGLFDFNPETGELFREGRIVHLQAQPAKVLAVLVSAKGQLVSRAVLQETLWGEGTSVDFDRSLNFAVAQLRTTLGDSAESPTFIRTVPKRGYQFIAPVYGSAQESGIAAPPRASPPEASRRWILSAGVAAGVTAAAIGGIAALLGSRAKESRIAVARFQNETGDPRLDRFADTITDSVVAGMTSQTAGRYGVIGNADILRRARGFQNLDEIASVLKTQYVILGQVQHDGAGVRVLAHLIRLPEKTHLSVSRIEIGETTSESQVAAGIVKDMTARLGSHPSATH
jgi:DNA-binding winged helix-turn-helix (wHTH) protein/TolB-like protein